MPTPTTRSASTIPGWWAALLFVGIVVVIPVVTTTLFVDRFPQLSPLDEFAHLDYLRRIEQGEVPRIGDRILPETAQDVACRTIAGRPVGTCGDDFPVAAVDAQGYSYEAQQPPLYYALTALLRQPFRLVADGFVNSARLTGMVWLSSGLAVLWWVLRTRFHASLAETAVACGLASLSPAVLAQAGIVNNDAASILIGAVVLVGYAHGRGGFGRSALVVASLVAAVLVLVKPLAVLPIGAASLALLIGPEQAGRAWWSRLRVLVPAAAAGVTYEAWQLARDARAVVPYDEVVEVLLGARAYLADFPFASLVRQTSAFLTAFETPLAGFQTTYVAGAAATVGLLFVYAPFIARAMGHGPSSHRSLHVGTIVVVIVAPMLLITQAYFQVRRAGGANPRYALALLPLMLTAMAGWLEERWLRRIAGAAVVALFAVTMVALLTEEPVS